MWRIGACLAAAVMAGFATPEAAAQDISQPARSLNIQTGRSTGRAAAGVSFPRGTVVSFSANRARLAGVGGSIRTITGLTPDRAVDTNTNYRTREFGGISPIHDQSASIYSRPIPSTGIAPAAPSTALGVSTPIRNMHRRGNAPY